MTDAAALHDRWLIAAKTGDRGARDHLVEDELALVRSVASRYRNLGMPYDDLVQEGALGLLDAIERFDADRGVDFERFARFRVRRAIRNALTAQARLVRLPKHVVEERRAAALRGEAAAVEPMRIVPLDAGQSVTDVMSDDDPELLAEREERARLVREAVSHLSPRERIVVTRRFGLAGAPAAIGTVASDLHLSRRRTVTIEHDALGHLWDELSANLGSSAGAR